MKTILAPVDFSEAAANALLFAADVARRSSARLVIVNIVDDENDGEAKARLNKMESDLKNSFGAALNCESSIVHGGFIPGLKRIIADQQPDLLVMGTKGASGLKRILIGSNTVKVIANTDVPILVIPEVARFEYFLDNGKNRVILATDLDALENNDALKTLKDIVKLIHRPTLRVLSVRPRKSDISPEKRMERDTLIALFNPEIECDRVTVFSSNVISGINYYLNEHDDSGLVAMIARDTGDLIQKHYTREMASHTNLPLLVMHESKK